MAKIGFIHPALACYAVFLTIWSYICLIRRSKLIWTWLHYGMIFHHFQIWRFITSLFCIGYPDWHMKLSIMAIFLHLRQYPYKPYMITSVSNPTCNFLVSLLYSIVAFYITCLFYPLRYGPHFIVMLLLTIETCQNEDSFELIGFTLKRKYIPYIYAFFIKLSYGVFMNAVFAILWGHLFLILNHENSSYKRIFVSVLEKIQKWMGVHNTTFRSREDLRDEMIKHYVE